MAAFTAASLGADTFLGTGAVGYRFVDTGGYWIDGIAGFRYTWTKTDLSFNAAGGGVLSGGEDENWLDGFVGARGARGAVKLDSKWSLLGYGDVRGGGSDYTWQAYAGVDYELNPNTHLSAAIAPTRMSTKTTTAIFTASCSRARSSAQLSGSEQR
jgi:hypothetical protein